MKKLIMFFAGLLLMVLMFAALFFAGLIHDTGAKTTIDTYFFQPSDDYTNRPGVPVSPAELGDDGIYNLLLERYITELFYVTPDSSLIKSRIAGETSLMRMSTRAAFDTWLQQIAPELERLASARALRTVRIVDTWAESDKYTGVEYELQTWDKPNNFSVQPTLSRGIIYLDIYYQAGMRESIGGQSPTDYLESGGDPAAVFRFGILDMVIMD